MFSSLDISFHGCCLIDSPNDKKLACSNSANNDQPTRVLMAHCKVLIAKEKVLHQEEHLRISRVLQVIPQPKQLEVLVMVSFELK